MDVSLLKENTMNTKKQNYSMKSNLRWFRRFVGFLERKRSGYLPNPR